MSPQVQAAIIAGCFGIVTLVATVIAQIIGFRSTRANTEQQIKATHKDTADTLGQQREQLDKTLTEQSKQLDRTLAEQRARTLNERFATAAEQLGSDKPPAVRLAGVYAMAGLADDWKENRQTCVDVLCAYLRMPYEPDPGDDAPRPEWLAFRASREVRHTVMRVITAHLKDDAAESWQGLNFDFRGTVFDGGSFGGARFSSGTVSFDSAKFSGGEVSFEDVRFSGGSVSFSGATFSGGSVSFHLAQFSGGEVTFDFAQFSGSTVIFIMTKFSGGEVSFGSAKFSGGEVYFEGATFSGGSVSFHLAQFSGGAVYFGAKFSGGTVYLQAAQFTGGEVSFCSAKFYGGAVSFSKPGGWSFPPSAFPWTDNPPPGVKFVEVTILPGVDQLDP
jgi:uncharacterized protein YjbI with pentapeptide repeats/uncharacterized membrane-anchored protein YhcB (DUF1043 family)